MLLNGMNVHMSSVQNPLVILLYWLVYRDAPFLDLNDPQYMGF